MPYPAKFLEKVINNPSNIIGEKIPLDSKLCIFNYMDNMSCPPFKKKMVAIGLMSTKRVIVINWKTIANINEKVWLQAFKTLLSL